VQLWRVIRADLSRPSVLVGRDPFLIAAFVGIGVLAQVTAPGSLVEVAALAPAVIAGVVLGRGVRVSLDLFAALVIVPVTLVVGWHGQLEVALFLPVMATLYTSWHLGSTIRATVVMVAAAASPLVVHEVLLVDSDVMWTPWTAANVFTFAMGLTLRQQRTLIEQLRAARQALTEQAVAEERRRIARELHDLAGHTLAAMMLHVTGARHVLERDPAEAERALRDAEQVGRDSLDQIRATVVALRADERGTDPALAGSADVEALVDSYRRAGLRVETCLAPPATSLRGPLGTAVHRIVQEGLANVARHAPGNRAVVTVGVADEDRAVIVSVSDHGRRPAAVEPEASRFGLVGMRERARALGGELEAGPHDDGWRVEARLPLLSAVDHT
jgi:signal transduction histidine kinase